MDWRAILIAGGVRGVGPKPSVFQDGDPDRGFSGRAPPKPDGTGVAAWPEKDQIFRELGSISNLLPVWWVRFDLG